MDMAVKTWTIFTCPSAFHNFSLVLTFTLAQTEWAIRSHVSKIFFGGRCTTIFRDFALQPKIYQMPLTMHGQLVDFSTRVAVSFQTIFWDCAEAYQWKNHAQFDLRDCNPNPREAFQRKNHHHQFELRGQNLDACAVFVMEATKIQ
jgi:hypothetical protein